MSNKKSLQTKVKNLIEKKFRVKKSKKKKIYSSENIEGWDSLGHMLLIQEIEKNFKISINPKDVFILQSEKSIYKYLDKKLKN